MSNLINGFDPAKLSPILGQFCAIKIHQKKSSYIGIGKLMEQDRKLTVYFECVAHLKASHSFLPWRKQAGMRVCGMINEYVIHLQAVGIDLGPEDWQKVMTDNSEILLSFREKEIKETDTFLDFHTKSQP